MTSLPRQVRFNVTSLLTSNRVEHELLLLQTARSGLLSQMTNCLLAALQLKQNLFVSLHSHHDLAMDVLDVHVLPTIASMGPHQRGLVSRMTRRDVVHGSRCGSVLQRCGQIVCIITSRSCLLD